MPAGHSGVSIFGQPASSAGSRCIWEERLFKRARVSMIELQRQKIGKLYGHQWENKMVKAWLKAV
jgi:hypothetical protein